MSKSFTKERAENNKLKEKLKSCESKLKKIQTKKRNAISSVSTLQKMYVCKKAALMSLISTHCKLSAETVSVSDKVKIPSVT